MLSQKCSIISHQILAYKKKKTENLFSSRFFQTNISQERNISIEKIILSITYHFIDLLPLNECYKKILNSNKIRFYYLKKDLLFTVSMGIWFENLNLLKS